MEGPRYSFHADFYDRQAELTKTYLISYYTDDNTTTIYDLKLKRTFLRRMVVDSVSTDDLYLGNCITIYGRNFTLAKYADKFTENTLSEKKTSYSFQIPLDNEIGQYLTTLNNNNLVIQDIYSYNSENPIVIITVNGSNALQIVSNNIPHQQSFSTSTLTKELVSSAKCVGNVTSGVILPHMFRSKNYGNILTTIGQTWNITAIKTMNLTIEEARKYLEIYNGVVEEFRPMIDELTNGKCIAVEVENVEMDTIVEQFRMFLGPRDPAIAQKIAASSIRAKYGENLIQNAIHCTDIAEDNIRDTTYLFKILTGFTSAANEY